MQSFGTDELREGVLCAPVLSWLNGEARGPGVNLAGVNVPAKFVRLATMKAGSFNAGKSVGEAGSDDVIGDVRGVLQMMSKGRERILRRRDSVRVGPPSQCPITHPGDIKRDPRVPSELHV